MPSRAPFLLLTSLLGFPTFLAAADLLKEPAPFELGTVVVTAYADKPAADALADEIDAAKIRKFERSDLADALKLSPGVILSNNGPRNEAGVSVRGFDLRQTPVFIDGIPVYVPYDGYVDLRRFSTSDVAEIRVSKGFSSAIYGANTMGGAINVVSRKPERPVEGDLLLGWIQENGFEAGLNVGFRQPLWYLQLGGSFLDVDSYPLSKGFKSQPNEDGGQRDNAYREDWRVSAKFGFTPNETDEYALGYAYQRGEKGNPVYVGDEPSSLIPRRFWRWPRWDKQTVYFIGHTQVTDRFYIKTRVFWDQFKNELYSYDDKDYDTQNLPRAFQSFYDDYTIGGSVEMGFKIGDHNTLKAALHSKFDHHEEFNTGAPTYTFEDFTTSFGIEDTHEFTDRWSLVGGFSHDIRSVLESVDTNTGADLGGDTFDSWNPQAGVFYKLPDERGTFHLTAARKSRFPTVKDRYSYRMGQAIPNPDLEPETAYHFDFGYEGKVRKDLTLRGSIFLSEIEDTIQRVDNVIPGRFQLQNVGESRHMGAEAGFDYEPVKAFSIGMNYAYLDRQNRSQPSVRLIDTPRHSFLGYADIRPVKWVSLIPSIEYGGSRYSTTYGVVSGAYAVTNLKLSFRLPENVTMNVGVNNIFDRNYTLTEGFPEAGRTFFASMQVKF